MFLWWWCCNRIDSSLAAFAKNVFRAACFSNSLVAFVSVGVCYLISAEKENCKRKLNQGAGMESKYTWLERDDQQAWFYIWRPVCRKVHDRKTKIRMWWARQKNQGDFILDIGERPSPETQIVVDHDLSIVVDDNYGNQEIASPWSHVLTSRAISTEDAKLIIRQATLKSKWREKRRLMCFHSSDTITSNEL